MVVVVVLVLGVREWQTAIFRLNSTKSPVLVFGGNVTGRQASVPSSDSKKGKV